MAFLIRYLTEQGFDLVSDSGSIGDTQKLAKRAVDVSRKISIGSSTAFILQRKPCIGFTVGSQGNWERPRRRHPGKSCSADPEDTEYCCSKKQ